MKFSLTMSNIEREETIIETKDLPRMCTIREIARTGLLSEYALRKLEKQGKLPCVYVGRKCLINLDRLIDQLNHPGNF